MPGLSRVDWFVCVRNAYNVRKECRGSGFAVTILPVSVAVAVAQLSIWLRDSGPTFVSYFATLATPYKHIHTSGLRSIAG
jgi:hypothetical protein